MAGVTGGPSFVAEAAELLVEPAVGEVIVVWPGREQIDVGVVAESPERRSVVVFVQVVVEPEIHVRRVLTSSMDRCKVQAP
jgi:hypothetical protein